MPRSQAMPEYVSKLTARIGRFMRTRGPRALLRRRDGNAAVEFALVAAPFLALTIAILETALVFFAQQVLQTATTEASRLIMTGQAQAGGMTATQFQQAVCADAAPLFSCSGVYVNVATYSSFGSVTPLNPISNGTFNTSMSYNAGTQGDIELVQVFYQWPVLTGPLSFNISNLNNNSRLLVATAVFRNEPY